MDSKPHAIINKAIISTRSPVCVYWQQVHIRVHAATRPGAVLRLRTGGRLVAAHRPDADVPQVGHIQRAVRRHHQGRRTVEPRVLGVSIPRLVAVAVGVVLQGQEEQAEARGNHATPRGTEFWYDASGEGGLRGAITNT